MSRLIKLFAFGALISLLAASCGGGTESSTSDVATTDDIVFDDPGEAPADADTADATTEDDATLAADEAALAFSQCMRDEGIDFPDIGVDAEGNPNLRDAFETAGITPRSDEFRTVMETCGPILQQAGFGARGGRAQLADNPEFQDALIEFSECLRDRGYDVGDIEFGGGPGDGTQAEPPADGEAPADGQGERGQGQGQGGFGDRNTRLAETLGLDIDDPQVVTDLDECGVVLDTALANAGITPPGQ